MRLILMAALAAGLTFPSHLGQAQDRSDSNRNVLGQIANVDAARSPASQRYPAERGLHGMPPGVSASDRQKLDTYREKINAGIVGLISGGIDGTYLRVASELASTLDDDDAGLRILPIRGRGSVQNIWDLVFARGVDIALVQSDALAYASREPVFPGVGSLIQYVASLYDEEVHVLTGPAVKQVQDLAGKKVNVDIKGSGTAMTARVVFGQLGIPIEATGFHQALALEKLKAGEIAASVFVAGKPVRLFGDLSPQTGLHFIEIPATAELTKTYAPARLTSEDYPVIDDQGPVETLSVSAVLAAYAWPLGSERYRRVARFVDAFFSHADALQSLPHHPKWHEVSLAAPLMGWKRFPAAEKWLKGAAEAHGGQSEYEMFMTFLDQVKPGGISNPSERDQIFAEFEQWRRRPEILQDSSTLRKPREAGTQAASGSGGVR